MKKGRRNFSSKSKGKFFDKKLAFFVVVVAIVAIAIVAVNVNKKEDVGLSPTSYSNCQKITINPSGLVACYSYAFLSHRFKIYPYQDGTYLAKSYNSDKKIIESFTCTATTSNGGSCSSPEDSTAVQITWGTYTECLEKGKLPVKGTLGSDGKCVTQNVNSYLLRAANFKEDNGINKTSIQRYEPGVYWTTVCSDKKVGDVCYVGNVEIQIDAIDRYAKTVLLDGTGGTALQKSYDKITFDGDIDDHFVGAYFS